MDNTFDKEALIFSAVGGVMPFIVHRLFNKINESFCFYHIEDSKQ